MEEGNSLTLLANRWRALTKEQQISVGILSVCGIIALVLSVQRIRAGIINPFTVATSKFISAKQTVNNLDAARLEEDASKRRDTDGDGLSDYDEVHSYGSSPFLSDTDGDGIPDNVELAHGTNPACPEGQRCATSVIDVSALASTNTLDVPVDIAKLSTGVGDQFYASFQQGINEKKAQIASDTGSTSTLLRQDLVRDPAEIRRVILESGKIDKATLDLITDAQLLQLYDQAKLELANKEIQGVSTSGITP